MPPKLLRLPDTCFGVGFSSDSGFKRGKRKGTAQIWVFRELESDGHAEYIGRRNVMKAPASAPGLSQGGSCSPFLSQPITVQILLDHSSALDSPS